MKYNKLKMVFFFLSAVLIIPQIFYWVFYDIDFIPAVRYFLDDFLGVYRRWFYDERMLSALFNSLVTLIPVSVIYLIFYRKEVALWVKLVLLFTGVVNSTTSIYVKASIGDFGIVIPIAICIIYSIIAVATIVGLIISMINYNKRAKS